jgi:hypothetical protein
VGAAEVDVALEPAGAGAGSGAAPRAAIDEAYRRTYARDGRASAEAMVSEAAAATTLRRLPV